jgi:hypothetical protein
MILSLCTHLHLNLRIYHLNVLNGLEDNPGNMSIDDMLWAMTSIV